MCLEWWTAWQRRQVNNFDMALRARYFPRDPDAPYPLEAWCRRRVRFEECDPLGMVWHGRYVSYLEDARSAFGDKYGLGYHTFCANRVVAPVVRLHIDYHSPLRLDDRVEVHAILHWSAASRLNFEYEIRRVSGTVAAAGYSVQLFTDPEGNLLLIPPDFITAFQDRWMKGLLDD